MYKKYLKHLLIYMYTSTKMSNTFKKFLQSSTPLSHLQNLFYLFCELSGGLGELGEFFQRAEWDSPAIFC